MSRKKFISRRGRKRRIYFLLLLVCIITLGIGFANISTFLSIDGDVSVSKYNPTYMIQYNMNGGVKGESGPTTSLYDNVVSVSKPTKNFIINIDRNGQDANILNSLDEVVTTVSGEQTFVGWTSSDIDTRTALYGSSSLAVTTNWIDGSIPVGASDDIFYFKRLLSQTGMVTLTANWSSVDITLPKLEKVGYTCSFNTESDGSGDNYSSEQLYTPSTTLGSDTLYVRCNPNTYSINYTMNSGVEPSVSEGVYDQDVLIPNPTKTVTIIGNANGTDASVGSDTTGNQTFTGWTSTTIGANAKSGSSANPSTSWNGTSTKNTYFRNLKETGTVTMIANWQSKEVVLPSLSKTGYTCKWYDDPTGGNELGLGGDNYLPTNPNETTKTVYARCSIDNPSIPTISGGSTKIYNSSDTTLSCATTSNYASGTTKYYSFGYATVDGGTPSNWTVESTSPTLTINKNAYVGDRFYSCRVYASDGVNTSSTIASATNADTLMRINHATITFNANEGTLSGTSPLYVKNGDSKIYTTIQGTTEGTIPSATKIGSVFEGWYSAATGGNKVLNADGTFSGTAVTGYTTTNAWAATTDKVLYARYTLNTYSINYVMNGGTKGTNGPTSGTYDSNVTINKPTKTFTVNIDANSQGATIKSGDTAVTSASSTQTFAGWTASGLDTTNAKYGTSSNAVTTTWSNGSTKVGASDDPMYFKNLRSTSGTVTLTANWTAINVTLPNITKTGFTCGYATSSSGSISYASGASYTPSTTAGSAQLYAKCTIQNPATPTITGGATKVYGSSDTTLTCATSTSYASGTTKYYSFGYATTDGGTPSNWTTASTNATLSVSKNSYVGDRYYSCRVYASDGVNTSNTIASATNADTLMRINNATITFNANGGTLSGTSPLYAKSGQNVIYTTIRGTTIGTIPTATSTSGVLEGWYDAATGGNKVLNADGTFTGTAVSGYTTASAWATTANKTLYAHYKEVKAENLSYDNTDTGVVCTDAQCMIDCIDGKLENGPSYVCTLPPLSSAQFASDSWETIVSNVKSGKTYEVGSTKEVTLGNNLGTRTLRVANNTTPAECSTTGFSQTACGFVLEFADIISKYTMNSTNTNVGGWPSSEMRTLLNSTSDTTSIINSLPTVIKDAIADTTVVSGHGSTSGEGNFTSTDKLYLLSTKEVWGKAGTSNVINNDSAEAETRQLDYYANQGVTTSNYAGAIKQYKSSNYQWWLRSASSNVPYSFFHVRDDGFWVINGANLTRGIAPAFRIA